MALPLHRVAGGRRLRRLGELLRFYQAAAVNTAFGYGLFALLVWLGVNLFAAQAIAHVLGVAFNYVTYSRHVFRDARGSKARFVAAYAVNYLVNLALLAGFAGVVRSPYVAGLLATVAASLMNYLALRHLVFVRRRPRGL